LSDVVAMVDMLLLLLGLFVVWCCCVCFTFASEILGFYDVVRRLCANESALRALRYASRSSQMLAVNGDDASYGWSWHMAT
jgi:hypothetical protein